MAEKTTRPIVQLTPEMKAQLEKLPDDYLQAEKALEAMAELGLDVSPLREKLDWAKKARETLLKSFS